VNLGGVMRLIPIFAAIALLAITFRLWPTSDDGLLAWVNISIMVLLSLLLLQYGFKLLRQRTQPLPGSRLRAKLVIGMVGLLLVPAMAIQIAASQMVERGMDVWFDVRVDTLLDRALNLAQGFYERVEKDLKRNMLTYISDSTMIESVNGGLDFLATNAYLSHVRDIEGWQKVELFDLNERLVAGVHAGSLGLLQSEPLSDTGRLAIRLGRISTELVVREDGEVAIGYAPLVGATAVVGLLRTEVPLPPGVSQNSRAVETDYRSYRQLEHNRQAISQTFTHVMLFVTLLVVILAGLVGLLFARRLTAPIGNLAHAVQRVTDGDLDITMPRSSQDELGVLAQSFNNMANRLKLNVEALEKAQAELTGALDNSRQRQFVLESLLANLQTGVMLVDGSGKVRLLNQAVRDILHLPTNWAPSVDILTASQGSLHDIGEFYSELAHQTDDYLQREFDIVPADGKSVHVLARGARLDEAQSSGFSGFLLVIDDISELSEAQRNKAWAEVARRLAHEIKNPLTPIKLSAERLQRRFRKQVDDQAVFDTCTQAIIGQVERLQRLIADFSTLARMPQPKLRDIAVSSLLQEMQELFNTYRRMHVHGGDPGWSCCCDPDQIRQVLINLVDNALASTEGTDGQSVRLYASMSDEFAEWHVEDDGPGIAEEAVPRLFEAYFSTKESGSGLGLAIAKRIAEDHGGELVLIRREGPAHFCLRIPRQPQQQEEA